VMKHMKLLGMDVDDRKVTQMLLVASFGIGSLFFMLAWPVVSVGLVLGIAAGTAGFHLVPLIFKVLYESRCDLFCDQMIDALTIMANGIKSGSNVQQSMARVVEIMNNPVKAEFGQVLTQTQFGQSFEEALMDLGERIPRPDVQMFVTAINILKETGGNLGETFQTIVTTIRSRQKLEKKISAMTTQGITQGVILTCIPFGLGALFFVVDPNFITPMFTRPEGLVLLALILGLLLIGGMVIRKIVTIKV
jgi:tight adherence protein B